MNNEFRRRASNWLLKWVPGLVEAVDVAQDKRNAAAVWAVIENSERKKWPTFKEMPRPYQDADLNKWARQEAEILVARLRALEVAKVEVVDKKLVITFSPMKLEKKEGA